MGKLHKQKALLKKLRHVAKPTPAQKQSVLDRSPAVVAAPKPILRKPPPPPVVTVRRLRSVRRIPVPAPATLLKPKLKTINRFAINSAGQVFFRRAPNLRLPKYLRRGLKAPREPRPWDSLQRKSIQQLGETLRENVTLVALDTEFNGMRVQYVTEVGVSILRMEDARGIEPGKHGEGWFDLLEHHHFVINDHNVRSRPARFCDSRKLSSRNTKRALQNIIESLAAPESGPPTQIVFVGHSFDSDLEALIRCPSISTNLINFCRTVPGIEVQAILDTGILGGQLRKKGVIFPSMRLGEIVRALGVAPKHWSDGGTLIGCHNAVNDAAYTMFGVLLMYLKFAGGGSMAQMLEADVVKQQAARVRDQLQKRRLQMQKLWQLKEAQKNLPPLSAKPESSPKPEPEYTPELKQQMEEIKTRKETRRKTREERVKKRERPRWPLFLVQCGLTVAFGGALAAVVEFLSS